MSSAHPGVGPMLPWNKTAMSCLLLFYHSFCKKYLIAEFYLSSCEARKYLMVWIELKVSTVIFPADLSIMCFILPVLPELHSFSIDNTIERLKKRTRKCLLTQNNFQLSYSYWTQALKRTFRTSLVSRDELIIYRSQKKNPRAFSRIFEYFPRKCEIQGFP